MASTGPRARSVDVSVEKILEQEVEEISRAGEEKYKKPLTLSEELTDFAHKINFHGEEGSEMFKNGDVEIEDDEAGANGDQVKTEKWPWESVRSKLRNALSEVSVLLDVLQVMKEKKYLVLEPVSQNAEPPKQVVQMMGKRKSLAKAAEVMRLGAERMSQGNVEDKFENITELPAPKTDYFSELMKLRMRWKVKKSGNAITGDLSYKSAGSRFWHPGMFEVKKTEDIPEEERDESGCPLTVRVSSDLEGCSRVKVQIIDSTEEDIDMDVDNTDFPVAELEANFNVEGSHFNSQCTIVDKQASSIKTRSSNSSPWQSKLKQAQHNLFCKELFAQISREAFHSTHLQSVQVTGNTIRFQLFQDALAEITYEKGIKDGSANYETLISGKGDVLEYRLQQMLHGQHLAHLDTPTPQPATAPWTTRDQHIGNLQDFLTKKSAGFKHGVPLLLDSFSDELKHIVLRKRTSQLFDRMSLEYPDPSIATEWSANAGPKTAYANIHIFSKRKIFCYRTSFHLKVGVDKFKAIDSDGTVVELPGLLADLENYVTMQISTHFARVALGVLEDFQWTILQHPTNVGMNESGLCQLLKARNSRQDCWLTLSISENHSFRVSVQHSLAADEETGLTFILDRKWAKIEGKREETNWNSIHGRTFVEKFYGFVASHS